MAEHKTSIEEIATQFGTMEQEDKMVMEAINQFWKSLILDEKLDQLTAQVQEVEVHLTTLKTSLKAMLLMVQITLAADLKDLQQQAARAQECEQKCYKQLNKFQESRTTC